MRRTARSVLRRGGFKDLANKLHCIKGLGFSAIRVTPVVPQAVAVDSRTTSR